MKEIGGYAFVAGLAIAVMAVFVGNFGGLVPALLALAGLIVGFLNIEDKDADRFLLGALMLVASSGALGAFSAVAPAQFIGYISNILGNVVAFVAPAGLVVAIKVIIGAAHKM